MISLLLQKDEFRTVVKLGVVGRLAKPALLRSTSINRLMRAIQLPETKLVLDCFLLVPILIVPVTQSVAKKRRWYIFSEPAE